MMEELKPCPFCHELIPVENKLYGEKAQQNFYICPKCGIGLIIPKDEKDELLIKMRW